MHARAALTPPARLHRPAGRPPPHARRMSGADNDGGSAGSGSGSKRRRVGNVGVPLALGTTVPSDAGTRAASPRSVSGKTTPRSLRSPAAASSSLVAHPLVTSMPPAPALSPPPPGLPPLWAQPAACAASASAAAAAPPAPELPPPPLMQPRRTVSVAARRAPRAACCRQSRRPSLASSSFSRAVELARWRAAWSAEQARLCAVSAWCRARLRAPFARLWAGARRPPSPLPRLPPRRRR